MTALPLGPKRLGAAVLLAATGLGVATAALLPARGAISLTAVVLLYLVPVLLTAVAGGLWPALGAAVAAALVVNWFFVPPYRTLDVDGTDNVVALAVYLLVAAASGLAVDRAAARAAAARDLARTDRLRTDRLRTALLDAVGHDLRTPLSVIKAAAAGLRDPDAQLSEADRTELYATVEESADRLTAVVSNLLDAGRLRAGALATDLRPTALDAVAAQAALHTPGARVTVDVPDDLPLALADAGLLERVLANLLDNARTTGEITVRGRTDGDRIRLDVIDHGPGIPAHAREAAFAPFQRLDDRTAAGLGLGLAIARGLTEAQGGTLTPATTPGGGLTMTISLAAAP